MLAIALALLLVLLADQAIGRSDKARPGASVGERLLLRARPGRVVLVVALVPVLAAAGALTLARLLVLPVARAALA